MVAPRVEMLEDRLQPSAVPPTPVNFHDTMLVKGLKVPTQMLFAPDGRLFISEQRGDIRIFKNGVLQTTPFLNISVNQYSPTGPGGSSERGLEGFVLDPNFERNGYVYVYYTPAGNVFNRISRFTVSASNPDQLDPNSERILLDGIPTGNGFHLGGFMRFGADGKLYVGIGDSEHGRLAQALWSLNGKILRLDPNNYPNVVPADNPFVGVPGARPEIWAYGFRNPFTGDVLPGTNVLFINDVGDNTWESVKLVIRGHRYGWPVFEGPVGAPGFTAPLYYYNHHDGRLKISDGTITGGLLYNGTTLPAFFRGGYLFSDLESGFLAILPANQIRKAVVLDRSLLKPQNLEMGPDGNLYYLSVAGQLHKLTL